jgi:enoyl-[acyl-carrier-protein] reductase (NADH)
MIGDPGKDGLEIQLRIVAVELSCAQQRVDRSSALAARIRPSKEVDDMTAMLSCRQQQLS